MSPYRDAIEERRGRARARFSDLAERAKVAANSRYGLGARWVWRDLVTKLDAVDFQNVGFELLDDIERTLDEAEEAIATWIAAAKEESEAAAIYRDLGPPSPEGMMFAATGERFRAGIMWGQNEALALAPKVEKLVPQLPAGFIADSHAMGVAFFFADLDGLPFRVDLLAKAGDEAGDFYTETTIASGRRRPRPRIAVRPQTFLDDVLATLRIKSDPTFDDEAFDAVYFVSGNEEVLREVMTKEVRAAFVKIAREEPVTLELADGIATMTLGFQSVKSACALLRVILAR